MRGRGRRAGGRRRRLGARKVHHPIGEDLARMGIELGRDALAAVLHEHAMVIIRRRRRRRTTNSRHGYGVWPNLLKELAVERVDQAWAAISMSEVGNPYDNAIAERINGILKQEFALEANFEHAGAAREAIAIYNRERPHLSLAMATPEEVYRSGPIGAPRAKAV